MTGERNNNFTVGSYMSLGNGSPETPGMVMPFAGRVVAMTMSLQSSVTGLARIPAAINKVEQTAFQVELNHTGGVGRAVADFSASPLAVVPGDALGMVCNTTSGGYQVVSSMFILLD